MITLWMIYSVAVGFLLGLAALTLEPVFRARGGSARGLWVGAMVGAWAIPVASWLRTTLVRSSPTSVSTGGALENDVIALGVTEVWSPTASSLAALDAVEPISLAVVAITGAAGVLVLATSLNRAARRVRAWPRRSLHGESVHVSPDFGPAVVGARRPQIVIPRWVLGLSPIKRALIVRHEAEHKLAGDTLLLTLAALAVLAAPWNPALWWIHRRLHLATELDCDRRVVRSGVPPRPYAEMLFDASRRGGSDPWPSAALSEPRSFLERRLTMIVTSESERTAWRPLACLALAALLVVGACETPVPPPPVDAPTEGIVLDGGPDGARGMIKLRPDQEATSDGQPLIVVDGVITSLSAEELSELEDIESVEVIKGAAARKLYGERAANGVVQVSTLRKVEVKRSPVEEGAEGQPLIYLDGIRLEVPAGSSESPLDDIDPDTIDRIEVIKGEAARELFGDEARNGVIQIFTKGG